LQAAQFSYFDVLCRSGDRHDRPFPLPEPPHQSRAQEAGMTGRILVLGAAGRFGYAAVTAFRAAGWKVTSLVRPGAAHRAPHGTRIVETIDRGVAIATARGMDIVLHALNPAFKNWRAMALPHAYAAIEAAETAGATLMFPGNLYNFGAGMPGVITETTPMQPTTRKGEIRVEIEQRMREASDRGMRAIILRAGDFFGSGRGSWFDLVVAKDLARAEVTYPGPLGVVHEWAYVPDLVAAAVRLAAIRDRLGQFETFGFPGHAVTGRDLVGAIATAMGRESHDIKVKRMSWWLLRALSPFVALPRELSEIAYLWKVPHRIAGDKLKAAIGAIPHTPFETAVKRALWELGFG
jgi:nucleoside-diphosphate-sugar epimerase